MGRMLWLSGVTGEDATIGVKTDSEKGGTL